MSAANAIASGDLRALVAIAREAGASGVAGQLVPQVVVPVAVLGAGGAWTTALGDGAEDLDLEPKRLTCRLVRNLAGRASLDGSKSFVAGALTAERALVAARADDDSLAIVAVDLAAPGVTRVPLATLGRAGDADLRFDAVAVAPVARHAERLPQALALATLVQAAEAAGMLDRLLELSVEQGHGREAFGRPVGSFESFQHACADMAMERELADTLVDHAAATGRAEDAARARAFTGDAAVRAARAALQLQGGRGFLDDNEVARLYRQAKESQLRWGSPRAHLRDSARRLDGRTSATGELLPLAGAG